MSTRPPTPALAAAYFGGFLALDGLAATHVHAEMALQPWSAAPALVLPLVLGHGGRGFALAAAAALASAAWRGETGGPEAAVAAADVLAYAGVAVVLRRLAFDRQLARLRDVLGLLIAAAAAAALVALAAGVAAVANGASGDAIGGVLALLFFSRAATGAAVLPMLLLVHCRGAEPWRGAPSWETVLQVASLLLLSWEVFGQFVNEEIRFFYLLFLPFAWIAARHGVAGAAAGLVATYAALVVSDRLLVHKDAAVIELQIRMLALAVTSLALGAISGERRAAEAQLAARQRELAHVLRLNIGSEMASALAHELNQPLTAAMSYNEAGLRLLKTPGADPAKAVAAFAKGLDQIEQAGDIIRRLREFMRKGDIQLAAVPLGEVVDDALRLAAAEIAAAGVVVHTQIATDLPSVLIDKTQIVQVLLNLVRNAVQAIEGAGRPGGAIRIAARAAGDEVEVRVGDDGPGLDAAVSGRLFEPFITTKDAGMGLGLSISKSIVEAHDGRLWAEPAEVGAQFAFTLPRIPATGAEHAA